MATPTQTDIIVTSKGSGKSFYIPGGSDGIVKFANNKFVYLTEGFIGGNEGFATVGEQKATIRLWGSSNSAPESREKLIESNSILPNLQIVARNLLLGNGVYCYNEVSNGNELEKKEIIMPPVIEKFWDESDVSEYLMCAANELTKHSVAFPQIIWNLGGTVAKISVKECKYIRAEKKNNGVIENYWFSGSWGQLKYENFLESAVLEKIEAYNSNNSIYGSSADLKKRARQGKFIYPIQDSILNDGYYPIPPLDGVGNWVSIMNNIPIFHAANIDNSFRLTYHVEIPEDYFFDYNNVNNGSLSEKDASQKAEADEEKFVRKVNSLLSGAKNAGRAVYTKTRLAQLSKDYVGIKITAISSQNRDKELLDLNDTATVNILSNQGVPAVLASIPTPNRLSAGSEIRTTLDMYLAMYTPRLREQILKPLYYIAKVNGWGNVKFGFKDVELTTLDNNKAGKQESVAQ